MYLHISTQFQNLSQIVAEYFTKIVRIRIVCKQTASETFVAEEIQFVASRNTKVN